jgi:CRISPR-associated endonuclease/helicase Cas3
MQAWGKFDQAGGELALPHHCADVAAVTLTIMALPTWRRRLERFAGRGLNDVDVARLGVLAFLHDVGKCNVGFQSKRIGDFAARAAWLQRSPLKLSDCGHTTIALGILQSRDHRKTFAEALPLREIDAWGGSDLWRAAISHHGDPIRDFSASAAITRAAFVDPHLDYAPLDALRELGTAVRTWFPQAFVDAQPLPQEPAFTHAFAGLVSLADWIASDAREGFFSYTGHGARDRFAWARERAHVVLSSMGVDAEAARADLKDRAPTFEGVFPFAPTALQSAMEDLTLGPLVVAEAETGSGKTEAALWRFKTLFEAGEVDALAFVLPTRVSAVALHQRVIRFLERLFPDLWARPAGVLAVPGYLRVDDVEGRRLAAFETLWPDDPHQEKAHRTWAAEHPKRFLAAPVAVGTIDQALLAGMTARHAHLRGAALLRALLVVDEVHASDAFMTTTLHALLERHVQAGGHALLLSATLGAAARAKFLKRPAPAPEIAMAAAYPAVSDIAELRGVMAGDREKAVSVSLSPLMEDPAAIAAIAVQAAQRGARVLIVRNTVAGVLAVQEALEEQSPLELLFRAAGVIAPHHGRFAAEDRKILDQAIEGAFGKDAPARGGRIVCGSQTLEISLDIDADLLITDLAPMDVLLQRIGRLHRHAKRDRDGRPAEYAQPVVQILTPAERDLSIRLKPRTGSASHGLGTVYDDVLSIEATWRVLADRMVRGERLIIPRDNRAVVEAVTHPANLQALAESLGEAWRVHWRMIKGGELAQQGQAVAQLLDWEAEWQDQAWAEPGDQVRTRLGLDARIVMFETPVVSPFGQSLTSINLPGWMTRTLPVGDLTAAHLRNESDNLYFQLRGEAFSYGRRGLVRG